MSPIVWDLGHIATFEDLWLRAPRSAAAAAPARARRGLRPVRDAARRARRRGLPDRDGAEACLDGRCARADARAPSAGATRPRATLVYEMVLRHEQQHTETILQTLSARRRPGARRPAAMPAPAGRSRTWLASRRARSRWAPAPTGFAYDNERPRHAVDAGRLPHRPRPRHQRDVHRFHRGRRLRAPRVVVARGLGLEGGGDVARPRVTASGASVGESSASTRLPVCHVSWFEADAFARSRGAGCRPRQEWEKGGDLGPRDGGWTRRRARVGVDRERVRGYPGFEAFPYREYSEEFFGGPYRVLRGGSWATQARRGHRHLPQLGLPERRQIFAGFRCATDADVTPGTPEAPRTCGSTSTCATARWRARGRRARRPVAPPEELPPKYFYDARGSELFEQITELPEYYPTRAEQDDPRRGRARDRRARAARRSSSSSAPARRARRTRCWTRCWSAGVRALRAGGRVRDARSRTAPSVSSRVRVACAIHGVVGDFERHLDRIPRHRRPAPDRASSAARSATSTIARRQCAAEGAARAARTRRSPARRHRPRQGPRAARGRLQRLRGRDRRVQPQRPAT